MKRLGLFFFLFLGISGLARAGSIFEVSSEGLADVRVFVVKYASQADLCVYVSKWPGEARGKDEIWYYTDMPGLADAKICFVKYEGLADLKVFFVNSAGMAGWKTSSKFRGKFK